MAEREAALKAVQKTSKLHWQFCDESGGKGSLFQPCRNCRALADLILIQRREAKVEALAWAQEKVEEFIGDGRGGLHSIGNEIDRLRRGAA